ncbi:MULTISPECIES: amino acid ABC transporter permease [Streptomyces]|uniref:Histidine/lysine/arginine/ornithine transport system permease protein HisM n=1 Tax=Streptomyces stelliscabiei TaxID=146820 RepID=A0A8I0TTY6_9ACTN|nr:MULTISPECIES: amino acid ABC transporter permease [Streptomyces]KND27462.1 ABC transporter permease [Streptomyces stelliscabiei]MBE1600202.1 polar amino acid transport system permease protein [Streptomyces stelliscabiei]MDX2515637.1 amino acid ABC transporter permease [Streptomyces stelliscabiei]MDX2549217.1 amino acid ABC transporter permease [Streptomyces stelliscabiei]MDX2611240.1 amino acid ABC transporter permease [Streptomyces stelliscabiei]
MTVDVSKTDGPSDTPPAGPEALKAVPVRHPGRYVSAAIALALLGSIIYAFAQAKKINWGAVPDYFFDDRIIEGVLNTLLLTVLSMVIGIVGGILLAVMRLSNNPVTSSVAWFYIWFFRGTPVLVQLFVWFNLGLVFEYINLGPIYKDYWSSFMTPLLTALLGLGLNEAAYMAEICRAGLLSVDEGQTEASHALGMSHSKTLRRIVIPQAMRVIVPPTGNEVINMLKTTSLVSTVQYVDLLKAATDIGQGSGSTVEMLFLAAAWYLILTSVFSVGQYYLERHYAKGSSRTLPPTPMQRFKTAVLPVRRPKGVSA